MSSSPGSPRVHILVPVRNRKQTTVRFVEALNRQTEQNFQLWVIDDGSTDGTAEAVQAIRSDVKVVRGDGNWWWAGALDAGCRFLARSGVNEDDVLLLINDDVVIGPEFLRAATSEFVATENTLLLARQADAASGRELDFGGGVHADLRELRFVPAQHESEINCLPTRGLLLRWRDFKRIGGFRPRVLPHYLSDYEFTLRAHRMGYRLRVAREATLGVRIKETGAAIETLHRLPRKERFKLLFSRRFKDNPMTWSAFACLTAAPSRRPYLLLKIWTHFLWVLASSAVRTRTRAKEDTK